MMDCSFDGSFEMQLLQHNILQQLYSCNKLEALIESIKVKTTIASQFMNPPHSCECFLNFHRVVGVKVLLL